MKRILSIVLLILFAFNNGAFLLLFKIQQFQIKKEIKKEIKENLSLHELTKITIAPNNINQIFWEHENEFRYRGIMYDVVKKEVIDSCSTNFYCITDTQETTLFKKLDILVNRCMDTKKCGTKSLQIFLKFISNLYPFSHSKLIFNTTSFIFLTDLVFFYTQPWEDTSNPPPQLS